MGVVSSANSTSPGTRKPYVWGSGCRALSEFNLTRDKVCVWVCVGGGGWRSSASSPRYKEFRVVRWRVCVVVVSSAYLALLYTCRDLWCVLLSVHKDLQFD